MSDTNGSVTGPYRVIADDRPDRYRLRVDDYRAYHRDGFLVVRGLVPQVEVTALGDHARALYLGEKQLEGVPVPGFGERDVERPTRIHMIHRQDPISEGWLLQPRILDVLEALIGPDVLALQTMLFLNPPGQGGQGWHQDSFYITTYPDTLIGTWLALDRVDDANGCLWVATGSHVEPIYPDLDALPGHVHSDGAFADIGSAKGASSLDDTVNQLSPVAERYDWQPVPVEPGDVLFFHSHLLHRSHPNRTGQGDEPPRWRRAFVSHYCNARSWVPWNHGAPFEGDSANGLHILARGRTHLPYALPRFGTPCAALNPPEVVRGSDTRTMMMAMDGEMMAVEA